MQLYDDGTALPMEDEDGSMTSRTRFENRRVVRFADVSYMVCKEEGGEEGEGGEGARDASTMSWVCLGRRTSAISLTTATTRKTSRSSKPRRSVHACVHRMPLMLIVKGWQFTV